MTETDPTNADINVSIWESESKVPFHPSSTLMTWLTLVRLPTVFTALSNILCGYFLTHGFSAEEPPWTRELLLLLVSSAGLYLGGMVLNDVCDVTIDRIERPERPIPSGRISRRAAMLLALFLMTGGVVFAAIVGTVSLVISLILLMGVVAYDSFLKKTAAGSLGMGLCRFLNLLLGASTVATFGNLFDMPQVGAATGLMVYIFGVTWFARNEAGAGSRRSMGAGLLIVVAGLAIQTGVIISAGAPSQVRTGALLAMVLLTANLILRGWNAIRGNQSRLIQRTVGLMLLSIIFLDATMVFACTGASRLAAIIVVLVVPASLLRRVIPMS